MSNIYFLANQSNSKFEGDHSAVIGNDIEGVMVECGLEKASQLAREWGLRHPMLAKDGIHYSESGDVVYIANGKQVKSDKDVAKALGWDMETSGLDAKDYLHSIDRIY